MWKRLRVGTAAGAERWIKAREMATGRVEQGEATSQNLLRRAHVSFMGTDELLLLGRPQARERSLEIVRQVDAGAAGPQADVRTTGAGDLISITLPGGDARGDRFLALPQKLNGERSLFLLQADIAAPTIMPLAPTATITVDRTDDPSGAGRPQRLFAAPPRMIAACAARSNSPMPTLAPRLTCRRIPTF